MNSYNILENINICADIVSETSQLLYYSHIPTAGIGILIGFYILFKNRRDALSQKLAMIAVLFGAWTTVDLIVWFTYDRAHLLMFAWSLYGIIHILLYITALSFAYTFIAKKRVSIILKFISFALFLPTFILSTTNLNLKGYNTVDCVAIGTPNYDNFYLYGGLLLALLIPAIYIKHFTKLSTQEKKTGGLFVVGVETFLLVFFGVQWGIGALISSGYIPYGNWNLEQYGLFSMPVFMALFAYLIVKYQMFNTKLVAAQVLVAGLLFLIASQFFFVDTVTNYVLVGVTLLLGAIGSFFLVKSVKKEIQQRELLEVLTDKLEAANERLKELDKAKSEFVSIASHQLRSPLTAIRGYASMLAEGSFGQMPQKALEAAKRIEESTKLMAMSIEDYLNVSRIESGNMKYNLSDFNLLEMTSKICDDLRPEALKQNLILLFRSDVSSKGVVNADVGKSHQIIHNLINNSIKYTQKGSISVFVREDQKAKRIYIDISDTGIGMSQKTIDSLFQKFSRADNANSVNTSGTGLGLYVAVKMAEAMNGSISASSEGDTKGSTFTFELPLAM